MIFALSSVGPRGGGVVIGLSIFDLCIGTREEALGGGGDMREEKEEPNRARIDFRHFARRF